VRVDQNALHAEGAVIFDEAHAPHVCGKVVDGRRPGRGCPASREFLQIQRRDTFDIIRALIPLLQGLTSIARTRRKPSYGVSNEMSSDEAVCSTDYDNVIVHGTPPGLSE